jgi:hypothetical protein
MYCCHDHRMGAILLVACEWLKGARIRKELNGFGVVICRVIELDREVSAFGSMPIRVFFESTTSSRCNMRDGHNPVYL